MERFSPFLKVTKDSDWNRFFAHNFVRKRARDKSRVQHERVEQAGQFGSYPTKN